MFEFVVYATEGAVHTQCFSHALFCLGSLFLQHLGVSVIPVLEHHLLSISFSLDWILGKCQLLSQGFIHGFLVVLFRVFLVTHPSQDLISYQGLKLSHPNGRTDSLALDQSQTLLKFSLAFCVFHLKKTTLLCFSLVHCEVLFRFLYYWFSELTSSA